MVHIGLFPSASMSALSRLPPLLYSRTRYLRTPKLDVQPHLKPFGKYPPITMDVEKGVAGSKAEAEVPSFIHFPNPHCSIPDEVPRSLLGTVQETICHRPAQSMLGCE